jgi:hypothetical protein
MDPNQIVNFAGLTLAQAIVTLLAIAVLDFGFAIIAAASTHTLSLAILDQWVITHIVKRVFPLFGLAVLGHGIAVIDLQPIGFVNLAFIAAAGTYALTTLGSIVSSIQEANQPAPPPPATTA